MEEYEPTARVADEEGDKAKQRSRERTARSVLRSISHDNSLQKIELYVRKTNAFFSEHFTPKDGKNTCALRYKSVLRTLEVESTADKKKEAKRAAVFALLSRLGRETT